MPYTQFTNLDFTQIKAEIKNYLRSNSNFTDFDFEGSNFSVLIDTLAYNTYINAFNANLATNEVFLDSAVIRENVVSLARNIGYVPRSKTCAQAEISFQVQIKDDNHEISQITLNPGLVCIGAANDTSYRFSVIRPVTERIYTNSSGNRVADFNITIHQGTYVRNQYVADTKSSVKYILDNSNIDTSTIIVNVSDTSSTLGSEYSRVDNILNLNKNSKIYLVQEIQDERIEILFGDDLFGKKLEDGQIITAEYLVTNGPDSNGATSFDFQGSFFRTDTGALVRPSSVVNITTTQSASNGSEHEDLSSIKYLAPRMYSAQYRAVTSRDYEAIIKSIYPATESIAVIGGEELDPPQFGKVKISIKPKNGTFVSDFDKQQIKNKLKNYSIAGIDSDIVDLKVLYVEIDSNVYYNTSSVSNISGLKTTILSSLLTYSNTVDMNKFGGRFKFSKINQLIDRVDESITSNITKVKIRRDMKALLNQFAQYELCFGNQFHINQAGYNIKSSAFKISGWSKLVYFTDIPNTDDKGKLDGSGKGVICIVSKDDKEELKIVAKDVGVVDYAKGEIIINTINITSTVAANNLIEVQAFPESNDVVGLKDLYLSFDVSNSSINMLKDVIASGEDVSGVVFTRDYYSSSYSNGDLERK